MDEASKAAGAEEETCEMSFDLFSGDLVDSFSTGILGQRRRHEKCHFWG